MKNKKTCGECRWYDYHHLLCVIGGDVKPTERARDCFVSAKPTNGDKIRQMSNAELAKLIVPKVMFCDGCPVKCAEKDIPQSKINPFGADVIEDVCTKRVEAWLNAPTEWMCDIVRKSREFIANAPDTNDGRKESEGKDE
jgi:hypothetical protein